MVPRRQADDHRPLVAVFNEPPWESRRQQLTVTLFAFRQLQRAFQKAPALLTHGRRLRRRFRHEKTDHKT